MTYTYLATSMHECKYCLDILYLVMYRNVPYLSLLMLQPPTPRWIYQRVMQNPRKKSSLLNSTRTLQLEHPKALHRSKQVEAEVMYEKETIANSK
jgi:hypothetical protein